MFDAKSLLEMMVRGAAPQPQAGAAGAGGLGDILGQLTRMAGGAGGAAPGQAGPAGAGAGAPGLDDLLRQLGGMAGSMGGAGQAGAPGSQMTPSGGGMPGMPGMPGMGGLADILAKMQQAGGAMTGGAGAPGAAPGAAGGAPNIMDILGQVLGQATSGAREGAERMGQATGADDALRRMTGGQGMDDMLAKLKDLMAQNQFGTGAAAGGLGAIVLGTKTGRGLAMNAAKLGALALIGGLAYKAYQNYQSGRPLISGPDAAVAEAAPSGSGFEPEAVTNDAAILYIRAMIAAANADGRIDPTEMEKIIGNLKQAGMDAQAEEFIARELNRPASIYDLSLATNGGEQAVQVYTAARIAITPDSGAEKAFLAELAQRLGIDQQLAAHIDAAARAQG